MFRSQHLTSLVLQSGTLGRHRLHSGLSNSYSKALSISFSANIPFPTPAPEAFLITLTLVGGRAWVKFTSELRHTVGDQ